jgi:hypothetical protein
MDKNLQDLINIYKQKRFKVNSEKNMDIDSHNVFIQVKKGRELLICDCCNDTKFCNESPMCRHKKFFIAYPVIKILLDNLNNKKENIKSLKYSKDKDKVLDIALNELNDISELRLK